MGVDLTPNLTPNLTPTDPQKYTHFSMSLFSDGFNEFINDSLNVILSVFSIE